MKPKEDYFNIFSFANRRKRDILVAAKQANTCVFSFTLGVYNVNVTMFSLDSIPLASTFFIPELLCLFCVVSILSGVYTLWRSPRENYPKGPTAWPFIGNVQILSYKPHLRLFNLKDTYGDIFSLKLGTQDVVVVCSLAGIQEGLQDRGEKFAERPNSLVYNALYNGDRQHGISTSDYTEKSYIKRGFIQACLDGHYANDGLIEEKIAIHATDILLAFIDPEGEPFDPSDIFLLNCLRVSLWLVYGQQFDHRDNNLHEILATFKLRSSLKGLWLTDIPMCRFLDEKKIHEVRQRTALQTAFQGKLLDKHKDTYDPDVVRDMIDQLLIFIENDEDRGILTTEDMTYLLLDITGSGFQATAVTMTWLMAYMACYPQIQVKVQEEIDSVIQGSRIPCLADQAKLPYTVATILEVERLASICPFLIPHRVANKCILQGYNIPENTWILFNVWSLHHDARLWKNPMKFNPDRFLENNTVTVPDHFLPYGLGPRCCVGESLAEAEIFLFFVNIMQQFHIKPAGGTEISLDGEFDTILRPQPFCIHAVDRRDIELESVD